MYDRFDYFYLFVFFGWIPILAFKALITGIIDAIRDRKCNHELVYEETQLMSEFGKIPTNVSVSITCKKCGYHKSYLKYKN